MEVLIEPVVPAPLLAVVGESPAARTLAELARTVGWRVRDDGIEGADAVVVATMGHGDEDLLAAALASGAGYVGLVASARRAASVLATPARVGPRRGGRPAGPGACRARPRPLVPGGDRRRHPRGARGLEAHACRREPGGGSRGGRRPGLRHDRRRRARCRADRVRRRDRLLLLGALPSAVRGRAGAIPGPPGVVRDILETLERWAADGTPVAIATVVDTERSAPRQPGAVLAVSEGGDVVGSVTGGCVEPAVYGEAREVLAGGDPRLKTYGIADEEAFEVGLPCGGTVHIFVDRLDPELVAPIAEAVREERPIALEIRITGEEAGAKRLVGPDDDGPAAQLLARGETGIVDTPEGQLFVSSFAPRPHVRLRRGRPRRRRGRDRPVPRLPGDRLRRPREVRHPGALPRRRRARRRVAGQVPAPALRSTSGRRSASSRTTTSSTCPC